MEKIYIDDSRFVEFITDVTAKVVEAKFGSSAIQEPTDGISSYTDEAQEFFDKTYDEIEELADTCMSLLSDCQKSSLERDENN